MRIALAQLDLLIGDIDGAATAIRTAAHQAAQAGVDLLVFPELVSFGGYPPRDLLDRPDAVRHQWNTVVGLARDLPIPALIGCVEPLAPGDGPSLANALVAVGNGAVIASYHKRRLPTYDVFDERRYFRPGHQACIITLAGKRIGLTVCEDIWEEDVSGVRYAQDAVRDLIGTCDVIVNASASPYEADKPAVRMRVVADLARRSQVPVVYCNQVGGHDELLFDGDSCIIAPDGRRLAQAPRWQPGLHIGDLHGPAIAAPPIDALADLYQALVTGIRDYCHKTRQPRVVLGISGGIDSALVAALAADALGAAQVTGLLMPGPYSSQGSIDDARALAVNLGIAHQLLDITSSNALALQTLAPIFAGRPAGMAEENLQSRLRGCLVMAVANKIGAMALTTGNKSEIAVGYCTLYGDTNGGLAPIGDVYKTTVWQLARWRNRQSAVIPQDSITKPPSAELRPGQTDQDSLPPYEVLDRILKRYIEDMASAADIIADGEDPAVVRHILHLVEVAEFKRRQGAPILRVSAKAFGYGRRMPVARYIG